MPGADYRDNLPAIGRVRIASSWSVRDHDSADPVARAIGEGRWSAASGYVKRDGLRWVWLGELTTSRGDAAVVIKGGPAPRLRLVPDRRALKQAIGASRLRAAGIETSEPIATLDVVTKEGQRGRWLVLGAIRGETLAHRLASGGMSFDEEAALARRAGELVRTLCDAGLFNRDHKASNLIVMETGGIGVVDTVAIRRRHGADARRRMLLAMCKELRGIGALPRRAQLMRCLRAASGTEREDWRAVGAMLRAAGDTTPRVDPLGRA
ncbi:MAG: hypothetical protein H6813_04635 [Phycisphaeraceae bacterium]|nr:hypothetical protein [Phycisphaeraceae bacterium]MCB9847236.1 hypothetical protein [Phycisphaeraceae bacterium]